jgi:anhydro-N-acetylmuramic acid kinase
MSDLYIGLMSGTSMDGIDAALVRFGDHSLELVETHKHDYPGSLREALLGAIHKPEIRSVDDVPQLHKSVGECFRDAVVELLQKAGVDPSPVTAIGSHGQTVRHEPNADEPFSLQIGDGAIIATGTGITTVNDFRTADIELGGQGAPLAPAFHDWLFRLTRSLRVVLNVGGIANVTILPADDADTTGFDTGPGNTLMDAWTRQHLGEPFDRDGAWATEGAIDFDLLERLLADNYFSRPPPKSTGFEYFNLDWLRSFGVDHLEAADVQATLAMLTARSIVAALPGETSELLVCGGGVHNCRLMHLLTCELPGVSIRSTRLARDAPDRRQTRQPAGRHRRERARRAWSCLAGRLN